MKYTENYGLLKPEITEFYDVNNQNDNMDIIDQKLKEIANACSAGAIVDNLESDRSDLALSARQGKILNDSLGGLNFAQDAEGNWGYIPSGADTVIPFKSGLDFENYGFVKTLAQNQSYEVTDKGVYLITHGTGNGSQGEAPSCTGTLLYEDTTRYPNYSGTYCNGLIFFECEVGDTISYKGKYYCSIIRLM